jgi:hypothetical protein
MDRDAVEVVGEHGPLISRLMVIASMARQGVAELGIRGGLGRAELAVLIARRQSTRWRPQPPAT